MKKFFFVGATLAVALVLSAVTTPTASATGPIPTNCPVLYSNDHVPPASVPFYSIVLTMNDAKNNLGWIMPIRTLTYQVLPEPIWAQRYQNWQGAGVSLGWVQAYITNWSSYNGTWGSGVSGVWVRPGYWIRIYSVLGGGGECLELRGGSYGGWFNLQRTSKPTPTGSTCDGGLRSCWNDGVVAVWDPQDGTQPSTQLAPQPQPARQLQPPPPPRRCSWQRYWTYYYGWRWRYVCR